MWAIVSHCCCQSWLFVDDWRPPCLLYICSHKRESWFSVCVCVCVCVCCCAGGMTLCQQLEGRLTQSLNLGVMISSPRYTNRWDSRHLSLLPTLASSWSPAVFSLISSSLVSFTLQESTHTEVKDGGSWSPLLSVFHRFFFHLYWKHMLHWPPTDAVH